MEGGRNDGLGKLLPKAISEKRRLRKQKRSAGPETLRPKSSYGDSDGTSVSNLGEDDDDGHSLRDDRSFGSFESGPDPETSRSRASDSGAASKKSSKSSKSASRNASRSPSRPGPVSQHPSLIGYLTTSSPAVQAAHLDTSSQSPSASPIAASFARPSSSGAAGIDAAADLPAPGLPTAAKVAPASPRARLQRDSKRPFTPLSTPPHVDSFPPEIVNTPPTPTHPPSIESESLDSRTPTFRPSPSPSVADGSPASRILNAHKRSSSASATVGPSKLSNVTNTPLTPQEEGSEPTSFFSSMISAAQNAATNFSTNIQNSGIGLGGNKARTTPSKDSHHSRAASQPVNETQPPPSPSPQPSQLSDAMEQKDSAVRTLGAGDLSLDQLGLDDPPSTMASPASARFADVVDTRARSESAPADTQMSNGEFIPEEAASRPRSLNEGGSEDITPATSQVDLDEKLDMSRTGSIRRAHRKRGSSVTTTGTGVNAGIPLAGVTSPVSQPAANLSTPKLTGFAIASKKRNRDFHSVFKSVPDDDYLIEDYSCALQREILAHGRLYVSEGHLCFSSNIMGWTTTLVISFDEIVSVEKRSTALIFKNGLMISTLHAKHVFASFTSRDATYDLIVNIWKLGHPTLTSTLNGVRLEGTGGDKTERPDGEELDGANESQDDSESEEESDEGEEFYDEEADEEAEDEVPEPAGEGEPEKAVSRKTSGMATSNAPTAPGKDGVSAPGVTDFPGPTTHAPTECSDGATHYDKIVGDEVIAAPLGKVYNLMFGANSTVFMTKFLSVDQKCTEVQIDDKKGLSNDNKTRSYTYIKPLYASLGPKQTKCVITEELDSLDLEKAVSVTISTQTPDVPSGNVFVVKTKYCLTWAENNSTKFFANCTVEWSGKSWIKGPIEKAANEGQADYNKAICAMLKTAVSSRSRSGTGSGPAKTKKKGKKSKTSQGGLGAAEKITPKAETQNWGPLEPVRQILEPITDLVKPLLTGNVMYGLLVGLLVASWFGFGFVPSGKVSTYGPQAGIYGPDRLAAYEEMWRREDSELWEWLEERIGLEQINAEGSNVRKKAMSPRTAEEKLREERLDVKDVEEALRVTEEKLRVMQNAMGRSSHLPEGAGTAGGA